MSGNRFTVLMAALVLAVTASAARAEVNIDFVTVGNPGNAGELSGESVGGWSPDAIVGGVDYVYAIGKYEVTAGQYTTFLNAVAATDTYGLYTTNMWLEEWGCKIERSGESGSYTYSVAADRKDRPVNNVSWYDAARFTNWLTSGDTEQGVYQFSGGAFQGIDRAGAEATYGRAYWIPTEDEWYKAAYHKNDGVTGNYWKYPTGSDSVPSNQLIDPDPGPARILGKMG